MPWNLAWIWKKNALALNHLWLDDVISGCTTLSSMVEVTIHCVKTSGHYLNHYGLIFWYIYLQWHQYIHQRIIVMWGQLMSLILLKTVNPILKWKTFQITNNSVCCHIEEYFPVHKKKHCFHLSYSHKMSRPNELYRNQWRPLFVEVNGGLFRARPLFELMLAWCQFHSWEQNAVRFEAMHCTLQ